MKSDTSQGFFIIISPQKLFQCHQYDFLGRHCFICRVFSYESENYEVEIIYFKSSQVKSKKICTFPSKILIFEFKILYFFIQMIF